MNKKEEYEQLRKDFESKFPKLNFEEVSKLIGFKRVINNKALEYDDEYFEILLGDTFIEMYQWYINALVGLISMNPNINEFAAIDYEFVQNNRKEILLAYAEFFPISNETLRLVATGYRDEFEKD